MAPYSSALLAESERHHIIGEPVAYYSDRAGGMLAVLRNGSRSIAAQMQDLHPYYSHLSVDEVLASPLTLDDTQLVVAREHGYENWDAFAAHVDAVAAGVEQEPFAEAFAAIRSADLARLAALLESHPHLPTWKGSNGNTLCNLACGCRQLPAARMLLENGADPNAGNRYGFAPVHSAGYSGDLEMAATLETFGAHFEASARGDGGTPLGQALFWGRPEAVDWFAARGLFPFNLRTCAGTGRTGLFPKFFNPDGSLTPEAVMHREFYRPHGGFAPWRPSDDRQEVLDEALVYAAKGGRLEAMQLLHERGASLDAEPYNGTPLAWALRNGELEAARWLLGHGAGLDRRTNFGGETNLTLLHVAAWANHPESVLMLLRLGADSTVRDDRYQSTPAGWAQHLKCDRSLAVMLDCGIPLAQAAAANDLPLARWLLERGAPAAPALPPGETPLEVATAAGHHEIVQLLGDHGA